MIEKSNRNNAPTTDMYCSAKIKHSDEEHWNEVIMIMNKCIGPIKQ
jgi:hypothetical protein